MIKFFFYNELKNQLLLNKVFKSNIIKIEDDEIDMGEYNLKGIVVSFDTSNIINILEDINTNKDILSKTNLPYYIKLITTKKIDRAYVVLPSSY
jgi:hypothetical protein